MKVSLSEKERLVAVAIQLNAGSSIERLAAQVKLKPHVFRHALQNLFAKGVLREVAWLDPFRLGYSKFQLYFSLSNQRFSEKVVRDLVALSPRTAWFASLGGNYNFGLTTCAQSVGEYSEYLSMLEKKFGEGLAEKNLAIITSFTIFSKKYLYPKIKGRSSVSIKDGAPRLTLDNLDQRIINSLKGVQLPSTYDLSRVLAIPRPTVQSRLEKLYKERVIAHRLYFINSRLCGAQAYKLLIHARGLRHLIKDAVVEYSLNNYHVVNIAECIGGWDYEFLLEVFDQREVHVTVRELQQLFGQTVTRIEVLPVFHHEQSVDFLRFS